jgi:glycerol-3-phosphate dehydrogenase (NAD(P)+)
VAGSFTGTLRDSLHPAAIAGPCIAGELARCVPTCVVLTGRDESTNRWLVELLQGPYYKVFPTTDVIGVEVCAALKNAFAMGIAFAEGMHKKAGGSSGSVAMHNLESAVFAQASLEMRWLTRALGSTGDSAVGLAGVGDLDVTTNGGRTGRFGRLLGEGLSVEQAIVRMDGATLECLEILRVVEQAFEARAFGAAQREQCPLLSHLIEVALHQQPVELPLERFFATELSR